MQKKKWFLFVTVFLGLLLLFNSCRVQNTNGEKIPDNNGVVVQKRIERIKHYREIITGTLPFKDILWEATTSDEGIKNITLIGTMLYIETDKAKLRAFTTDIGRPQWVLNLATPLNFPPCDITGLSQKQESLKVRIRDLKKQLDDAEISSDRDENKINGLKESLRSANEVLKSIYSQDVAYYISEGLLYCLDRWSGDVLWRKRLDFVPKGGPTASGTIVYISSIDFDRVYYFDVSKKFERDWLKLDGSVVSHIYYESPAIYFACDNGKVYAFNADTGAKIWDYKTEQAIRSDILIDGDIIYVGSTDYAMYAIDRNTGTLRWKYETGLPISSTPYIGARRIVKGADVIIEKTLFFRTDKKEDFYSLLVNAPDLAGSYKLRWKFADGKKYMLFGLAGVYILGKDDITLYSLDIEKGDILDKYSLRDFPFRAVDPNESIIYLGTADGYVFAVREPPPKW
ncbi:MAG: PQQ-binding-like beta-propeller repeat protein [Planctomycetes bacterium]|nr:PQQ-binding-like beta-propeller repeat protein [Planctomycetota bacterium]